MSRVTLDVFIVNPFVAGSSASPEFAEADIRWLFDHNHKRSFSRYWDEVSGGLYEIDATVHPALNVQVTSASLALLTGPSRAMGAAEAMRLVVDAGRTLGAGRRAVVFIGGFAVNAGTTGILLNNQPWTVAYIDMRGPHSFMAHEIGHVLGLDEDFDLRLPPPLLN